MILIRDNWCNPWPVYIIRWLAPITFVANQNELTYR
jgi:hypothetical protein